MTAPESSVTPQPPTEPVPAVSPIDSSAPTRQAPALAIATVALSLLALVWVGALALMLWADLAPAQRDAVRELLEPRGAFVVLFVVLLPLAIAFLVRPWVRNWPRAAQRLREEVMIIASTHAGHRVTPTGAHEMRQLAAAIDVLAQTHAALRREVDARIAESNARLAEETRRLAALMSELMQGVLVCNRDGRILLYNAQASTMLAGDGAGVESAAGARVGLGRSIFGVLDKGAIVHAWEQVMRRVEQRSAHPVASFVTTLHSPVPGTGEPAGSGALLQVRMVPIRDGEGDANGYVLIVDDITRAVESDARRDALLQRLTEGTRSALGNLRAAAQTLLQYPAMDAERRTRFTTVIHDECERLARQLSDALADPGEALRGAWPREDIQAADLALALQHSLQAGPGVTSRFDGASASLWLHLDSHAIVQLLTHLIGRLAAELDVREVTLAIHAGERFARLEVGWQGSALEPQRLHAWEASTLAFGVRGFGVSVQEVLARHGAEMWTLADRQSGQQRLTVQLPAAQAMPSVSATDVHGRPVYYDFDLFHQPGQSAALDETPLEQLSYTVFDTETTGLRPSEGDEIISIGAVRIVNGRLLQHEYFDRLTRPRRRVRKSAQAVHGITPQMLAGQPPLEQVLPQFARFCEDTVLVAHNAAFDMRFLELARERTGIRFDQPVLDTLLLSSVVQPGHQGEEHHLEQIAARLGVAVVGRHTALGDAFVTGEVFLKLLPLMAERGIRTLRQAREASQQSMHARLTY